MVTVNCLLNVLYLAAAVRPTIAAASRQTVRASAYVAFLNNRLNEILMRCIF